MRGRFKGLVALQLMCALLGCGKQMTQDHYRALVNDKVQIGMTAADVERQLGIPHRKERLGAIEFFFYRPPNYVPSQWVGESHSPIAIRDHKVVGIGKAYYDGVVKQAGNS